MSPLPWCALVLLLCALVLLLCALVLLLCPAAFLISLSFTFHHLCLRGLPWDVPHTSAASLAALAAHTHSHSCLLQRIVFIVIASHRQPLCQHTRAASHHSHGHSCLLRHILLIVMGTPVSCSLPCAYIVIDTHVSCVMASSALHSALHYSRANASSPCLSQLIQNTTL